ncbi:hypothetical protein BVE84_05570 [Streptococcus azizii]|uniref:Uncharacterized protein n=1 Tax=Streptococcus azizii TaxID=1579424 RepID=A0AB36JS28_9STRE|nr:MULTISPECIES: hypothetical protein [Streptococcus]QBX22529.1 hypothetical protein Javan85_0032 [Streptococcus phage Javan85]QBX31905.1 hypothetical protein Javan84_0028 [Streptococcus phage Javan84]MBF0775975.1 hypothetical protein [Streptococcus sp. 19428wD3_AN2]MBF0788327.1 hypothetical protein [Streptococcus sp. 19428wC2_LYSM12]ONK26311.1 hypothetical protein BVE86_07510 [Streptococcus azizii]
MANWAEGTIKLRGRAENIASALEYMFSEDKSVTVEKKYDGELLLFKSADSCFYIKGTRRALIIHDTIEIWLDDDFLIVELDNFKQAWSAISANYQEISSKFDVDIKIFTFEMGMEFTQEIEIHKGVVVKDIVQTYDNYSWEVPFASLGG